MSSPQKAFPKMRVSSNYTDLVTAYHVRWRKEGILLEHAAVHSVLAANDPWSLMLSDLHRNI